MKIEIHETSNISSIELENHYEGNVKIEFRDGTFKRFTALPEKIKKQVEYMIIDEEIKNATLSTKESQHE